MLDETAVLFRLPLEDLRMPEWMTDALASDLEVSTLDLLVRFAAATLFGVLAASIYRVTQRSEHRESTSLTPTLVLLAIIIAMVTMAIGNSVARAFSLVGALAIVRFRTVVEDTRDTAFVIYSVAVGLAVGAGLMLVPLLSVPFVAGAAFAFRRGPAVNGVRAVFETLVVRVGAGRHPDALLGDVLVKYLDSQDLKSAETAKQGSALDLTYAVRVKATADRIAMVTELNTLVGVQEVKLARS